VCAAQVDSALLKGCGAAAAPVVFKLFTRLGGKWLCQPSDQG
jgi:hypothetical protein